MLSTTEALRKILQLMPVAGAETVALRQAAGRVLAQSVRAGRSQPPFRASAMDGYAVNSADIRPGAKLAVIGEAQAGRAYPGRVNSGQAVRISTGAPLPDGADRVLIQEDAERSGDSITVGADADGTANIRPEGADFRQGDEFAAPKRLTPADIGLLAAMNVPLLEVRRKPLVAIITTGDELVMPGEDPGPDQIIASNGLALAALLEQQGAEARLLPIARDHRDSLQAAFALASGADLVLSIGGASVGDHDLVRATASDLGLQLEFWKVAMRPGKPLIAGRLGKTPFLGLPGNPVSAMVCGHVFLRPAIDAMLGLPAAPLPRFAGVLAAPLEANGPREHYLRATVASTPSGWRLTAFDRQDSSLFSVLAQANALIVQAPGQPAMPAGTAAEFILL